MTGEKNRYKTLETLVKIDDKTLKTPEHDELILYLLNKENVKRLIPEVQEFFASGARIYSIKDTRFENVLEDSFWKKVKGEEELSPSDIFNYSHHGYSSVDFEIEKIREYLKDDCTLTDKFKALIKEKEPNFEVNKLDELNETENGIFLLNRIGNKLRNPDGEVNASFFLQSLSKDEIKRIKDKFEELRTDYKEGLEKFKKTKRDIKIYSEVPITNPSNNFLMFYIDIMIKFKGIRVESEYFSYEISKVPRTVYIEAKPQVDNFGETLRQINTYKEYTGSKKFYLFTPDLKFKDAFENQGVTVISPPQKQQTLM